MSTEKVIIVQVKCNKCGKLHPITGDGARDARKFAKEAGWKLGKQKDFCPSCAADIAAAIKLAQSGGA